MKKLSEALQLLNTLTDEDTPEPNPENKGVYAAYTLYDKLVDYVHYVETLLLYAETGLNPHNPIPPMYDDIDKVSQKRKGRTTLFFVTGRWELQLVDPRMYTRASDLQTALAVVRNIYDEKTLKLLIDTASVMRDNVAPRAFIRRQVDGTPLAQGTIQVKTVNNRRYMYYRYWVSGGGRDKRQKRFKSFYIGMNKFTFIYDELPVHSAERREVEARIIAEYELVKLLDPVERKKRIDALEEILLREYGIQ